MADKKLSIMKRAAVMAVLALGLASTGVDAYTVSFDTSAISGGDYYLEFQLTDGDSLQSSFVVLSNFAFGGGGSIGIGDETFAPLGSYSVEGDPLLIKLYDFDGTNLIGLSDVLWKFTAGSSLNFDAEFFWSSNTGATQSWAPDRFNFIIIGADWNSIPTTDQSGLNLLSMAEASGTSASYGLKAAPVPEPATMLLFGTGLAGLAGVLRRKMKAS